MKARAEDPLADPTLRYPLLTVPEWESCYHCRSRGACPRENIVADSSDVLDYGGVLVDPVPDVVPLALEGPGSVEAAGRDQ